MKCCPFFMENKEKNHLSLTFNSSSGLLRVDYKLQIYKRFHFYTSLNRSTMNRVSKKLMNFLYGVLCS